MSESCPTHIIQNRSKQRMHPKKRLKATETTNFQMPSPQPNHCPAEWQRHLATETLLLGWTALLGVSATWRPSAPTATAASDRSGYWPQCSDGVV